MADVKTDPSWIAVVTIAVISAAIHAIAWFTRGNVGRYEDGLKRIGVLEVTSVTHSQLDAIITKVTTDLKADRVAMHGENKEWLKRIEEKIDTNERRRSETDHTIRDTINSVNLQVVKIATKQEMQEAQGQ